MWNDARKKKKELNAPNGRNFAPGRIPCGAYLSAYSFFQKRKTATHYRKLSLIRRNVIRTLAAIRRKKKSTIE
jgi:hypothetical protein